MLPLFGDERRFKQVVINLVKNAMKFTKSGYINIKTRYCSEQRSIIVHIEDTGCGIVEEDIPQLFNRFSKPHRTVELNSSGIGLGLTIAKQIVHHCGGKIEVESNGTGKGSLFIFSMKMDLV